MKILLVDPAYKTPLPPLGLLKLGRFHRERGDFAAFVKGTSNTALNEEWDRIYVSSLFTFQWRTTLKTLRFYEGAVKNPNKNLFAGGPMATLLGRELAGAARCRPIPGVLDTAEKIGLERVDVDALLPDFSLIPQKGMYPLLNEGWIASATRGCGGQCAFCSVREVDPRCVDYVPLDRQAENCRQYLGERDLLVLLDNNVAGSPFLERIVRDILALGFDARTAPGKPSKRVDFSQGFEPALLAGKDGERRAELLSALPLRPVRIAWDFTGEEAIYRTAAGAFASRGFRTFSTPVLYGFMDRPGDAYYRFRKIIELEMELGIEVLIEPMGYIPPGAKRRPSPRERARAWGCSAAEAQRFEELARSLAKRKSGDLEWFKERFGRSGDEFSCILRSAPRPRP
ncbi:MAG: hypothetical protein GX310_02240 [Synergistaceae bacterium]|nr:hypothetical protein [Synergistaceae bacterium]